MSNCRAPCHRTVVAASALLALIISTGCPVGSRQEGLPKPVPAAITGTQPAPDRDAAASGAVPDVAGSGVRPDLAAGSGVPQHNPETDDDTSANRSAHSLSRKPVDPIEANGPVFEGWPKPNLAVLISGMQIGYLEPCGCAGLENQKGGLKRRHTLVKELAQKGWPLLMVDLGGQIKRFGPQAEIKFRKAIESLTRIGYQAVGFGPQELRLPVEQLVFVASNLPDGKNPFVAANVGLLGLDSGFAAPLCVVEVGGRRVGITSILGTSFQRQLNVDDIELLPPAEALAKVVPQLREQADVLILLSHAPVAESTALAEQFADFDIVVTAGDVDEPPSKMKAVADGRTQLVEVGRKAMYMGVLGLYDDPQQPPRFQRVPLDARFADSPEMQAMMVDYQKELATLGLEGLALKAASHPSGRKYVGSQRCADCHTEATAVWENTPHAHATETLVKLTPPRHHDPECLSCHVTGWEPQKYFPFASGYADLKQTSHLHNVGCENCHGPGSQHVAAEEGDVEADDERLEELRTQMRIALLDGEAEGKTVDGKVAQGPVTNQCYECHDLDNSPDFDFVRYWPEVEHYGMD